MRARRSLPQATYSPAALCRGPIPHRRGGGALLASCHRSGTGTYAGRPSAVHPSGEQEQQLRDPSNERGISHRDPRSYIRVARHVTLRAAAPAPAPPGRFQTSRAAAAAAASVFLNSRLLGMTRCCFLRVSATPRQATMLRFSVSIHTTTRTIGHS
jgi:hypothetical protein